MPAGVPDEKFRGRLGEQDLELGDQRVVGLGPAIHVLRFLSVTVRSLNRRTPPRESPAGSPAPLQCDRRIDQPGPDRVPPADVVQNGAVGNDRDSVIADEVGQFVQPARWPGGDHHENTSGALDGEHRGAGARGDGSIAADQRAVQIGGDQTRWAVLRMRSPGHRIRFRGETLIPPRNGPGATFWTSFSVQSD